MPGREKRQDGKSKNFSKSPLETYAWIYPGLIVRRGLIGVSKRRVN